MRRTLPILTLLLAGCSTYKPPAPPTPRDATHVAASMGRTWDAVIDRFAAQNIPIRTIERVSGLIVTDRLSVGPEGSAWAKCGKVDKARLRPNFATYNVLVRGDSSNSTVKATVRWIYASSEVIVRECSTTHQWERDFETVVKTLAEAKQVGGLRVAPGTRATAPTGPPAPAATQDGALAGMPPGTRFVASVSQKMYYPAGCSAAKVLPQADKLYYANEEALRRAGFRRSVVC